MKEEVTLRTLQEYKEVLASSIQDHRGRVVGTAGDSVLAEFASVVDAAQCAVEIQQVLRAKNALLPENRRMGFRIGINLGDVIEEGDAISPLFFSLSRSPCPATSPFAIYIA